MAISRRAGRQRVSQLTTTAAPTGGINDTDPLAMMDPKYCLSLNNIFPANSSLTTRKGYREWALLTSTDATITVTNSDPNDIVGTATGTDTAYTTDATAQFVPATTNTGAVTIDYAGSPKDVYSSLDAPLVGGELVPEVVYYIQYNGTYFRLISRPDVAPVKTLIVAELETGTQAMLACTDRAIYDATVSTDNAPVLVPNRSSGVCHYAQMSNPAGEFLVIVNGVDQSVIIDGYSNVTYMQNSAIPAIGNITGADPSTFIDVTLFKARMWFIAKNSTDAYYLDIDSLGGACDTFPLGGIFKRGGYLVEVTTWSYDGGQGMDDQLVFRSSTGEVAIYRGEDPELDMTISSLFFLSPPVGNVPSADLGGDLLMLTAAGIIPISRLVQGVATEALYDSSISRNISRTLNAIRNNSNFTSNWEIHNISSLQSIIVNIPAYGTSPASQYIMNITNGSWARYTLPARSLAMLGGNLVFGDEGGGVHIFGGESYLDGIALDGSGGTEIDCSFFSAFNYFGDPTTNKHFKLIRPILQSSRRVSMLTKINVDYDLTALTRTPLPASADIGSNLWDSGIWDDAIWGVRTTIYRDWLGANGIGFCAALLVRIIAAEEISFTACEWAFEAGTSI